MSVATLPFPPQSTTRRPFRRSLVLAARAAFQSSELSGSPLCDWGKLPVAKNPGYDECTTGRVYRWFAYQDFASVPRKC